jgi:hypothetical protein
VSQPPPPATSEAPVIVLVIVVATASVGLPERQSLGSDFDYDQFELTPRTSAPGTTTPTSP